MAWRTMPRRWRSSMRRFLPLLCLLTCIACTPTGNGGDDDAAPSDAGAMDARLGDAAPPLDLELRTRGAASRRWRSTPKTCMPSGGTPGSTTRPTHRSWSACPRTTPAIRRSAIGCGSRRRGDRWLEAGDPAGALRNATRPGAGRVVAHSGRGITAQRVSSKSASMTSSSSSPADAFGSGPAAPGPASGPPGAPGAPAAFWP